jgi:predicted GNAT superfamily acetyltransferase
LGSSQAERAEAMTVPSTTFTGRDGRSILIRSCRGFEELDSCVRFQIDTWGYSGGDVIPRRGFVVAQRIGGQVIGAFDLSRSPGEPEGTHEGLVGFAMSYPGAHGNPVSPYLHSHMLAVDPAYRNDGIGRRLKLFQRTEALERGIQMMEWTFDPLEIKNAFLNIHKLGAIVRSYTPNFYGVSSSRLQGGLPTDRLHAEWHLGSPRVQAILDGERLNLPEVEETILVPWQVAEWKSSETEFDRALEVQAENRRRFQAAFARGLAIAGFRKDTLGNGIFELVPFEHLRRGQL